MHKLSVVSVLPRESPDFELAFADGARVGLEVVEVAVPEIAKGASALDRLESALADRLRRDGLDVAIHLGVPEGWAPLLAPKDVIARHVAGLAELVGEHLRAKRGSTTYDHDALLRHGVDFVLDAMICEGSQVTIGHRANGRRSAFVQESIDAKNAKISDYREEFVECDVWLLLLIGINFRSAIWSVVAEDHEFSSAFDRTFCLDAYENRVFEVRTRRPAAVDRSAGR